MVREFASKNRTYITLDEDTVLEAVRNDPSGFVRSLDTAIVDEVQRAPALLRAIKKSVDTDRRPGRFLLTGSANLLTLLQVSESLAGRASPAAYSVTTTMRLAETCSIVRITPVGNVTVTRTASLSWSRPKWASRKFCER